MIIVSMLCIVQFIWTLYKERIGLGMTGMIVAASSVIVCNFLFAALYRAGSGFLESNVVKSKKDKEGEVDRTKQVV